MCSLKIKNQRILIVVAHPDDEVLWFYAGIESLQQNNKLEILCLTHTENSVRGRELISFGSLYQIRIIFANLNDSGINRLLVDLAPAINSILNKTKYDLAITHPPHGGEKPHPHHIQAHFTLKELCRKLNVKFAFFSEYSLQCQVILGNVCQFSVKNKKFIFHRIKYSYYFLRRENFSNKFFYLYKSALSLFLDYSSYELNELNSNIENKKKALSLYKSQEDVLRSYNSYYRTREYLFIRSSNFITSNEFNSLQK